MSGADGLGSAPAAAQEDLARRVAQIARQTRDDKLAQLVPALRRGEVSEALLCTRLMDTFRVHRDLEAYSLLYELSHRDFLLFIAHRLRKAGATVDPGEVLQDVFVSIFRYPNRFRDEHEASFRNWSATILRNTVLKHLRRKGAKTVSSESFEETLEDESRPGPLGQLVEEESREECGFLWLLVLANYRRAYEERLNEREQRALALVEIEGRRYREVAEELGVKLENLKMIICRARKKILRRMAEIAGGEE